MKNILKIVVVFLLLLVTSNSTTAFEWNICEDTSLQRIVTSEIPLSKKNYTPEGVVSLKGMTINGKNTEQLGIKLLSSVKLRKDALIGLIPLANAYQKEFKKPLFVLGGYSDHKYLKAKKLKCRHYLKCLGDGSSDVQTGLGFFLIASSNGNFTGGNEKQEYKWLKDNAWKYGIVQMYQGKEKEEPNIKGYWRYMGTDTAKVLHDNNMSFYEFIKAEKDVNPKIQKCFKKISTRLTKDKQYIDSSLLSNSDNDDGIDQYNGRDDEGGGISESEDSGNALPPIDGDGVKSITEFKTSGFTPTSTFPGTFSNYRSLKENILGVLRVNLVVSKNFSEMEDNFGMQNTGPYADIYEQAYQYAKQGTNARNKEVAEKVVKIMEKPFMRFIGTKLVSAIALREHGGNIKINPNHNHQGVLQLIYLGYYADGTYDKCGDENYIYYTKCDRLTELMKPGKVLSKEDILEQFINYYLFADHHFRGKSKQLNDPSNTAYSYYANIKHMLQGINVDLKMSNSEIEELTKAIINKDSGKVQSVLINKKDAFTKYAITKPDDLFYWLDIVEAGVLFSTYNGQGNNGHWLRKEKGKVVFVLDHAYVSNSPYYGVCFEQCAVDKCAYTNVNVNAGAIFDFIKVNYADADIKDLSYGALLKTWKQSGKLQAAATCRN